MSNFARACSSSQSEEEAISEVAETLDPSSSDYSILFVSNNYDLKKVESKINEKFSNNIIACTTAGEVCCGRYENKSIAGLSFKGEDFLFEKITLEDLENLDEELLKSSVETVKENENKLGAAAKSFGIVLIDGLSIKEEILCGFIGGIVGDIPVVGGSAGDGLEFNKTLVFGNKEFKDNSAVILFVTTTIPFEVFKIQHFKESDLKLVITEADPENRIVKEINGEPAAKAYSDLLGIDISEFSPTVYSRYPLMLKVGDEYFVRSIQKVNEDQSLTFYCAIDNGLVLTVADKKSLVANATDFFQNVAERNVGNPECTLLFECILRRLEVMEMPNKAEVFELYEKNKTIGFHTYGEQFGNIHINQTLVGVVFGKK